MRASLLDNTDQCLRAAALFGDHRHAWPDALLAAGAYQHDAPALVGRARADGSAKQIPGALLLNAQLRAQTRIFLFQRQAGDLLCLELAVLGLELPNPLAELLDVAESLANAAHAIA